MVMTLERKKIAEIKVMEDIPAEELHALKVILVKSGLLIECKGREIEIYAKYARDN